MLLDLASRNSAALRPGHAARYLATGHLVFVAGGTLSAIGFDADRLQLRGAPVPLVTGVRINPEMAAVQFALAESGTLAYLPAVSAQRMLVWIDRKGGKETAVGAPPRAYSVPRISPDGTRIAFAIRDNDEDVHLWDVSRRVLRQLTFDPGANTIVSWVDNERVAYSGTVDGWGQVFEQRADGMGTPRQVTTGLPSFPFGATRDGTLIVGEYPPDGGWDIGLVPIQNPGARTTMERTKAYENNPALSPDGRWLAYQSNKTGRSEIYVRPFPVSGQGEIAITAEGGTRPVWAGDGSELYYWTVDQRLIVIKAIRITPGPPSGWGAPTVVLEGAFASAGSNTDYDVRDGRFLLMKDSADGESRAAREIVVIQNWHEAVRRLAPAK
jgi:serine/threonine-protein kinase